ncbi:MAG: phosphate ABC transporter permease PstA [Mycobacterium sp.]|nr:phosphate ABC transporter permease PstA [Mycobacterium sp.]
MTLTRLDTPVKEPSVRPIAAGRRLRNGVSIVLCGGAFVLSMVPLVWVLHTVVSRGFPAVTSLNWWTRSMNGVLPEELSGGVAHAIYGTLVQVAIASFMAVPLGVFVAIYLVEYGRGWPARATSFMVDILSGVPSIVAALFVFSLWIATLGLPRSGFAVSLALVLLMIPMVARSAEEMLKRVPDEVREAAYALGITKGTTIARIVVPSALPGMISGILIALARVMGETAPVLVLIGYTSAINFDALEGNMASLPLLIYSEWSNPVAEGQHRVWGAALTLIILVAAIYLAAALVSRYLVRNRTR